MELKFTKNEKCLKKISKLLSLPYSDIQTFLKYLQKKCLRAENKERHELKDEFSFLLFRSEFLKQFQALEMIDVICAKKNNYKNGLLLGAGPIDFLQRLQALFKTNVTFDKLYVLTGHNALRKKERTLLIKKENIKAATELEMIERLRTKYDLDAQIIYSDKLGSKARANTKDTAREFIKRKNHVEDSLIISNQPYGLYQKSVIENIFKHPVDLLASKNTKKIKISVYLDVLARLIYEAI